MEESNDHCHLQEGQEAGSGDPLSELLSLTSIPRKVVEQIILEIFSKHMKEKTALESCQHGF